MTPAEWQERKAIFEAVLDTPPAGRAARIADLCAGDEAMAQEIRRLVENASAEDPFLDATPAAARELAPGQVLCERFELLRLVGEGGMGQVWAADDRRLSETIAVKTIQRGLAGEGDGLKRLQRELQLARRIGHAHVCRVFELFEDTTFSPSRVFVTMELLEGETLASRLRREGRLVPAEALRFFQQIVSGLDAVHAAGVVHRDLKPSNIMLSTDAATGQERAVVMDFGLARALDRPFHVSGTAGDADLTRTGQAMGTFEYMAPEQVRAEPATAVTDVYALGLILFEMLDGQPPFAEQNTMGSWMRRMREVPPKLAEGAVPGLDPRVDEVIAKCLEFEPSARFPSAAATVSALSASPQRVVWRIPGRALKVASVVVLLIALVWLTRGWWLDRSGAVPDDARRWYSDAQRDLSEGAAARAAAELRRAITRAPRFAAAHAAMAETQLELDQAYKARESIQRATDLAPDRSRLPESEALHIEGINRLILGDCPGAIDSLRRRAAVVDSAERPTALALLARAYERCEMTSEARKALSEAAAADPRNAAVLVRTAYLASRRQDRETADRLLTEAESLYRERANFEGVAEVLSTRGTLAAERDQLYEATAPLAEALTLARTTGSVQQQVRVLLQQAIVARKHGDLTAAEKLTGEGVSLARKYDLETLAMQGLFTAANVHFLRNQFDQAETGFQSALEIATRYRDEGNQARAWLSLASMNVRRAQPRISQEYLDKARSFFEKTVNRRVLRQIEQIENQIRMERADFGPLEAILEAKLTSALAEHDAELADESRRGLRDLYLESGRWPEALAQSREIKPSEFPPGKRAALDLLVAAEALAALGRFDDARTAAQKAALSSSKAPILQSRVAYVEAVIDSFQGRWADARIKLRRLQSASSTDPVSSLYIRLVHCRVTVWSRDSDASSACARLAEESVRSGNLGVAMLARLSLAEGLMHSGAVADAAAKAAELVNEMKDWKASEWRWRAEAISGANPIGRRKELSGALTSFSAQSRLDWLGAYYPMWRTRPDVSKLIQSLKGVV